MKLMNEFQSTPPVRGATMLYCGGVDNFAISIHAPREGGDGIFTKVVQLFLYFNPRPPRGGRPWETW